MQRYNFTKECELGIVKLDEEHKQFFSYINAAVDAVEESEDHGIPVAKNLLVKLKNYAEEHFDHEERFMLDHQDAELFAQIHAHQGFRDRVAELSQRTEVTKKDLADIFAFMGKWLYSHILASDTLIGKQTWSGNFKMTKEFITGIEIVDDEHAKLFEIINRVYAAIGDQLMRDKFDEIMGIIDELKEYAEQHFADEEAYMEKIGYEGLQAQKNAHELFIARFSEVNSLDESTIDENQEEYLRDIVNFLTAWLINHILKMDKKIPVAE